MMGSDIHHRTEDFRNLYKQVLADLKEVLSTSNDVLVLVASGSGAMEAATQNFFSPGDEVMVCSAGKFGERWVEIMKAWGIQATVLTAPYGQAVQPSAVEQALTKNKNIRGVFVQASETSTGTQHDIASMGRAVQKTEAIFVVDAAGYQRLGIGHRSWRISEGVHDPSGTRFSRDWSEGVGNGRESQIPPLLFRSEERKEECRKWRICLDAEHRFAASARGGAEVH
jgi:hypothetical protein